MIQVENLVKKYGEHLAVDHLSFEIEKGQIYGFLGPNGAGKSTTMNIITGYLGATSGTVLIDGIDITKEPEKAKRKIGYLPEIPPLYMDMTVEEYLLFAAELKGIKKEERKNQLKQVMEMVLVEDVKSRLIKNLSKGYKQRVGLAQAIIGFPDVIILDEPTVGLDPKQIIEIRELIKELGKNHTVILSSHILSEVSAICDQILIVSKGKLVAKDTPEHLALLMKKEQTVNILVKGEKEKIEEVLQSASFLKKVTYLEEVSDAQLNSHLCRYEVVSEQEEDIREPLLFLLAKENLAIMELTSTAASLEDVFLELTSDEHMKELLEHEISNEIMVEIEGSEVEDMETKVETNELDTDLKEGTEEESDAGNL